MVKGTKTGFFTDMDGNFELSGIDYPVTLVVSYIGFSEREVNVNGTETDLTISLSDDQNLLDDVVVVADELFKRERLEHVFRLQVDIFSERETVQHVCV
jgi:hypothetical protein